LSHCFTVGGPSGSGKTSLAHKMANIVGCEVVSLESYFKSEQVKDFKHDDFSSLDLPLLSKNISDITNSRRTKLPIFDLETGTRCGFKELEVPEECGVVSDHSLHISYGDCLCCFLSVDDFYTTSFFRSSSRGFMHCIQKSDNLWTFGLLLWEVFIHILSLESRGIKAESGVSCLRTR
jgi:hypothetical protein